MVIRKTIQDKQIHSISYNTNSEQLTLEFNNRKIYIYLDVPISIFLDMIESQNKGSYLNRHVKGSYGFSCVENLPSDDEEFSYKDLLHHYHFSIGMWVTDRPDLVDDTKHNVLFQIKPIAEGK